jgi:CDP-diacylglycerol--glycerol-3-phosphate 3-phosphatidyltransferase
LVRSGLSAGTVTALGLLLSIAVPFVVLPRGLWLFAGAGLVFLAGLADSSDGAVAILSTGSSRLGTFYDSMADRLSEAAWLMALWLLGAPGVLVAFCGAQAWLHEYARARAALSGMPGVGVITAAERPTRVLLVIAALVAGGAVWPINDRLTPGVITIALSIWAVLGLLGAAKLAGAIRSSLR